MQIKIYTLISIFGMSVWASERLNKHKLFNSNFVVTYYHVQ